MAQKLVNLQHQLRNNNEELQDFMRGLADWTKEMKTKDEQLKAKSRANMEKDPEKSEPLRSVEELKRKGIHWDPEETYPESERRNVDKKKKRGVGFSDDSEQERSEVASAKGQKIPAYDYDSWSKFDVEKALAEVDDAFEQKLDVEDEDMDEAVRLQEAVAEKERGNNCFKVAITLCKETLYGGSCCLAVKVILNNVQNDSSK